MRIGKMLFGLIGTLLVLIPRTANAQMIDKGLKAGIAFTALPKAGEVVDQIVGGPRSTDTGSKTGLTVGGFARFRITDRFGFQPELLFAMKGVKLDEPNNGKVTVHVNYLEFPLLFRYSAAAGSGGTAYAFVGPSFGVKVSASGQLDSGGQTQDVNIDPAIRSPELGLAFGGGIEYSRYLIELRYTLGLTDIANDARVHAHALRNQALTILAGIKF